jgi:hypothetical protein
MFMLRSSFVLIRNRTLFYTGSNATNGRNLRNKQFLAPPTVSIDCPAIKPLLYTLNNDLNEHMRYSEGI